MTTTPAVAAEPFDFESLWDYAKPAETEAVFRELLTEKEAGSGAEYGLQLKTQIARTLGLQGRFDEASELLDEVHADLSAATPIAHLRLLLERGRTLNSSGSPEAARPLFEEAWQRGQDLGADFHAVDAAHMVAIVTSGEESLAWNAKAMTLAEGSSDTRARGWLGSLYNNVAWTLHDQQRYDEALEIFQQALAFRTEAGKPGPIRIARWSVARALRSLGRVEEALVQQESLYSEGLRRSPPEEDPYVREELGECLLALGRGPESRPHLKAAWEQLSKDPWMKKNETERLERLERLAKSQGE